VVRLVNAILTEAVQRGASDVHIECFEHEMRCASASTARCTRSCSRRCA
jgi:hypothetical protein